MERWDDESNKEAIINSKFQIKKDGELGLLLAIAWLVNTESYLLLPIFHCSGTDSFNC